MGIPTHPPSPEYAALAAVAADWMDRVWRRRDLAALSELHAPDFRDRSSAGRDAGLAAYEAGVAELFAAFPDFETVTDDLVVDTATATVAIRWTAAGTHAGSFLGAAPTGRRITFRGIEIIRIAGGRITERWGEWDGLDLLDQLGAAGTSDSGGTP
jgi:steroid delta-isomerase-like uncharacterized protein